MYFPLVLLVFFGTFNPGMSTRIMDADEALKCSGWIMRHAWGGKEPGPITHPNEPQSYVLFHHTCTSECNTFPACSWNLRLMQDHHMNALRWTDIAYSFYIGGDGEVYQGRGWNVEGPVITRWYMESLTIGFIGDFSKNVPSDLMMTTARKLVDCGISMGMLPDYVKVASLEQVTPVRYPAPQLHRLLKSWPEWMRGSP